MVIKHTTKILFLKVVSIIVRGLNKRESFESCINYTSVGTIQERIDRIVLTLGIDLSPISGSFKGKYW